MTMLSKQFLTVFLFSFSSGCFDAPDVSCSESRLISPWAAIMLLGGKPQARYLCWYTKSLTCRFVPNSVLVSFYCWAFLSYFWDFCCYFKIFCNLDSVFDLVLFVLSVFCNLSRSKWYLENSKFEPFGDCLFLLGTQLFIYFICNTADSSTIYEPELVYFFKKFFVCEKGYDISCQTQSSSFSWQCYSMIVTVVLLILGVQN